MIGLGHLPSIENLQCFVAAATHLNFRRASEQMTLTPAAFGQRIRQLEEQLHVDLFLRTTRHVELTMAGRRLLPAAELTIRESRKCLDTVLDDTEPPAQITIGTRYELGMSWILPAVLELQKLYPNWSIDLYFGSGSDIQHKLQSGHVDAIITSAPIAQNTWISEFLHPETYVFAASPVLLEETPFDSFEDSIHHILLDINNTMPLARYLSSNRQGISFKKIRACGAAASMIELALAQQGVAVLPKYMVLKHLKSGALVRLCDDDELLSDSFRLIFRRTSMMESALRKIGQYLRDQPLQ